MRVKISYGINMEEVPEEVSILLDYAYNRQAALEQQLELIAELVDEEDLESTIGLINKARRSLVELDSRLADIEAIAQGYVNYQKEEEQQGEKNVSDRGPFMDSAGSGHDGPIPGQSGVYLHK